MSDEQFIETNAAQEASFEHTDHTRTYIMVFFALAVLTALELIVTLIRGIPHAPILLTMSVAKALMVIFFFMHLRWDSRWFSFIFFAPFLLVVPMIIVMLLG
jgi:cytochrome c oxidase subunit 4